MRPSSFFSVLAAVAYARPITPFNDSIFDNLRDLIFGSVGGLFSYPYGLYGQASCFAHNFESKLCPAQCVPNCMGEAEECSECLISCYRDNTCFGGNKKGDDDNETAPEPTPEPTPAPGPADAAGPADPQNAPDAST